MVLPIARFDEIILFKIVYIHHINKYQQSADNFR